MLLWLVVTSLQPRQVLIVMVLKVNFSVIGDRCVEQYRSQ